MPAPHSNSSTAGRFVQWIPRSVVFDRQSTFTRQTRHNTQSTSGCVVAVVGYRRSSSTLTELSCMLLSAIALFAGFSCAAVHSSPQSRKRDGGGTPPSRNPYIAVRQIDRLAIADSCRKSPTFAPSTLPLLTEAGRSHGR